MWRKLEPEDGTPDAIAIAVRLVSVSYNEAGRLLDGGEQVEAVPMAQPIRAWIEPFVAEHYKPYVKRKSKRNPLYERDDEGTAPKSGNRERLMSNTMNNKPDPAAPDAQPLSLKRWSQRKLEARRAERQDAAEPVIPPATPSPTPSQLSADDGASAPVTLPPIESLTPESDFTAFFSAKAPADDAVKRAALKVLLRDPRFNVMDGLDTYIDDYTREDPIPESVLRRMVQAQQFLAPEHREVPAPAQLGSVDAPPPLSADATPEAALPDTPSSLPAVDSTAQLQDSQQPGVPPAPLAAESADDVQHLPPIDPRPAARSGKA